MLWTFSAATEEIILHAVKFAMNADIVNRIAKAKKTPAAKATLARSFSKSSRTSFKGADGEKKTPISALSNRDRKTTLEAKRCVIRFRNFSPSLLAQNMCLRQIPVWNDRGSRRDDELERDTLHLTEHSHQKYCT